MSLQKKYYYTFKGFNDDNNLVEIWQNTTDTIIAEEIQSFDIGFNIELISLDNKFETIRGSGCEFNLLSNENMKFFNGLYHINPKEFIIKHYINNIINWVGYMNSELFSETFSELENYPVTITGNDGFSLMNRIPFLNDNKTNITGIKSKYELLQIIFNKLGLPLGELRISLSTIFEGYNDLTNSTILHQSFLDCANFYDEDNVASTIREVLEIILKPYAAFVLQEKGNIIITDINTIASNDTIMYKCFSLSDYSYINDVSINNKKTISDIGYAGTGQSIEVSGGINKQIVSYSPYPITTVLESSITGTDEFINIPEYWSTKNGYHYKTLIGNTNWQETAPATFETSYYTDVLDTDTYFRYPRLTTNQKVLTYKTQQYLNIGEGSYIRPNGTSTNNPTSGVSIKINGEILTKTKDNIYDETVSDKNIAMVRIGIRIKVGNQYFTRTTEKNWTTTPTTYYFMTTAGESVATGGLTTEAGVINDKFFPLGYNGKGINLFVGNFIGDLTLSGNLEIEIFSTIKSRVLYNTTEVTNSTDIKEIWIKNLSVDLVNYNDEEIEDNDIEYTGNLNEYFENEGNKITLKCGTDSLFTDRGKIMKFTNNTYSSIKNWTRANQTFKIEELLLNSVTSNYKEGFIKLDNFNLNNNFNLINVITDKFLDQKRFMIKSALIDYGNSTIKTSLVQIQPDSFIIIKEV